jgi:hypothetical protein
LYFATSISSLKLTNSFRVFSMILSSGLDGNVRRWGRGAGGLLVQLSVALNVAGDALLAS